jgi:Asp-tRNA(Asn)/Glu-tRNA(Gln) amidotransferase A subunit family amidase
MPKDGYAAAATRRKRLDGVRLGVVRPLMTVYAPADAESVAIAQRALGDLVRQGATLVDPVPIDEVTGQLLPVIDPLFYPSANWPETCDTPTTVGGACPNPGFMRTITDARTNGFEFRFAFDRYLATRQFPGIATLADFIATGPFFSTGFQNGLVGDGAVTTLDDPEYAERQLRRKALQEIVLKLMADFDLDALVYPMKTIPASIIGGRTQATVGFRASSGNILSSITGYPSVLVPAGFTETVHDRQATGPDVVTPVRLPVVMEFYGRPCSEALLVHVASAYEAGTQRREPPPTAPPL